MKSLKYCENHQSLTQSHKVDKCWENGIDTFTTRIDGEGVMPREINQTTMAALGQYGQ